MGGVIPVKNASLRLAAFALALALAAAISACGGGGGSDTASQPEAKTPIADTVTDLNKAIADQDCKEYTPLNFSLVRLNTQPGAPASATECKNVKAQLASLKGVKYTDSTEYGTGAIASGGSGHDADNGIFVLDRDGTYRLVTTFGGDKQVGSSPVSTDSADANAQAFVDAIKAGDCKKAEPLINPKSPGVQQSGGPAKYCDTVIKGKLLAPQLKATDNPTVEPMGASLDLAFYGVPTKDAWFTLIMASNSKVGQKQAPPDQVFDYFPSTDLPGIPAKQG